MTPAISSTRKFCGMFTRRERWGLSRRGWLVLGGTLLISAGILMLRIQPFLAVTDRVDAHYLVMEGWVHLFTARAAAAEFKTGGYDRIYITGLPVEGSGEYEKDSDTDAWVGAGLLRRAGVPEERLQPVPRRKLDRNRTYGSALALKAWFDEQHLVVHALNVVTEDAHARRTRLMFQEAFGPDVKVGIISVPDPDYDQKHWWRYSEGVREILGETVAYLYAKCLFYPSESKSD